MLTEAERGAIDRMERRLDDLVKLVQDVRERLANMEGKALHSVADALKLEIEVAKARIAVLESERFLREGQVRATATWAEWLHRLAPWGLAVALVTWNYFKPPL